MERPVKGDIVVLPFPFSDLSSSKRRPALVLASLEGEDCILAQMTSTERKNNYTLSLKDQECKEGSLRKQSYIRTDKIFTANKILIEYRIASITEKKKKEVEQKIIEIITKE